MSKEIKTTCAYCGVGCGIIARVFNDGRTTVEGDKSHPANFGRLCAKGAALGETLAIEDRLLYPKVNGKRRTWVSALNHVAKQFSQTIQDHGRDSVAFYVSGQLLSEDYYVANKLMKGFIGSGNIDTNSRLCMASSVAGHKRAFGEDIVPGVYQDLELADLVVLVGSNLAWCHPVLHQRLLAARESRGTKIVVVDPRETATTSIADLHLSLRPGTDVALYNGLLKFLNDNSVVNREYINNHCENFEQTLAAASGFDLAHVSSITGLADKEIENFYRLVAAHPATVTVYSQGVNQSSAGTDKVNAIINTHLATGRIGKPGSGPFSVTGQPNAMGGRETGGLANTLAAHIDFQDEIGHKALAEFWGAPKLAENQGLKAVDLFREISKGKIKALWIMATNPAVSLSSALGVKQAIEQCDFVVVSDIVEHTDSSVSADVLLPAAGWGEKDGTVTNSERRISRQRRFVDSPGEAKPDWWVICEVAKRMGFEEYFDFPNPAAIFREYAATTGLKSRTNRVLDVSALQNITDQSFNDLSPLQWPYKSRSRRTTQTRLFTDGHYPTPNGKARFVPTAFRAPASAPSDTLPFILNSGRVRDQWHTMTRSINAPQLSAHIAEPYVEVNPTDAERLGIKSAELVEISTHDASVIVRGLITQRSPIGSLFVPMHWSSEYASRARINELIVNSVDPISGQPELKFSPVAATRFNAAWYGFAVVTTWHESPQVDYWARMKVATGWRVELAHGALIDAVRTFQDFSKVNSGLSIVKSEDVSRGVLKLAYLDAGQLVAAFFVSPEPVEVSRAEAVGLLGKDIDHEDVARLFTGVSPGATANDGPIICTCMSVGAARINKAIECGASTIREVGKITDAGTNCGSCRMEIQQILSAHASAAVC